MTSRRAKATTGGVRWAWTAGLSRRPSAASYPAWGAGGAGADGLWPASRRRPWGLAGAARPGGWRAPALLWVFGLAGAVWAAAQVVPVKRIRDFRMPEFYETTAAGENPRLKTLLTGAEAQPLDARGRLIAVTGMRVENYLPDGRTNLVARAPACVVDALDRTVCSTGWLEVTMAQGQLFIEGQGFFLQVTNLHFILSNRVRTVIRPELVQRVQP